MGASLCCFPRPPHLVLNSCRDRCCHIPFLSCCGMYEALLQPCEENDGRISSAHNDSCAGNPVVADAATTSGSSDLDESLCTPAKVLADQMHLPDDDSSTMTRESGCIFIGHSSKVTTTYNEEKKPLDNLYRTQLLNNSDKEISSFPIVDEDDICPICLEGYDFENPKLTTKCGHCFHLSCILEWMERSSHCAICYQEMAFNESL